MKTFYTHSIRNVLAVVIALGLGYAAYLVSPSSVEISKVSAATPNPGDLTGWAWSEGAGGVQDPSTGPYTTGSNPGIGWISLSGTTYGVNISPLTGTGYFSGDAWSENVGWISFNQADTATCGATRAQVNWSSGNVSGWARALAGSVASGWDGCIKLAKEPADSGVAYGVTINTSTGTMSGLAWGSDVVGWVDFAPKINGVTPLSPADQATVNGVNATCPTGTYGDPSYTWGTCNPTGTCTIANAGKILTNQPGTSIGVCSNGVAASPVVCNTATLDCTGATPPKPKYYQF
jgi:hypothetical protein